MEKLKFHLHINLNTLVTELIITLQTISDVTSPKFTNISPL